MKGAHAIIVAIFVGVGSSVAFAQPRVPARNVRLVTTAPSTVTSSPTASFELPRRTLSPDRARALAPVVFGAAKGIRVPAVEHHTVWIDPPEADDAKKPLRRLVPKLIQFQNGGAGLGLKLRY